MPDLVAAAALSASGGQVRVVVQCGSFESTGPCSDANLIYSLLCMQDAMRLGGDNSAPTMRPGLVSCSPTSRGRFLVNGALGTPPSWWHRSGRRIPPLAPCRPGPPVRVHGFGLASCRRGGHGKAPAHGRGFGRGDAAAGRSGEGGGPARAPGAGPAVRGGPGGTGRALVTAGRQGRTQVGRDGGRGGGAGRGRSGRSSPDPQNAGPGHGGCPGREGCTTAHPPCSTTVTRPRLRATPPREGRPGRHETAESSGSPR